MAEMKNAMRLVEIIERAQDRELTDEDGEVLALDMLPGLDEQALARFESSLPCALPEDVRELLRFCRGFDGVVVDQVDFTGRDMMFEPAVLFPHGVAIASDGFGNYWVVDLSPDSTEFGPVWFACHDPPVVLYQSRGVREFLEELFKMCEPPYTSLVDDVHEDRIRGVWRNNPGVLSYRDCVGSEDAVLREFAVALDPSFEIIDLRAAAPGDGLSWGRYGPRTVLRRHGVLPVFAYQRRKGLLARILGS